jgi:hypothetical protein
VWQPTNRQWWILVLVTLVVIAAWPPQDDRSLAAKVVNWAVDPTDALPLLPDQLGLGEGDNPDAVAARDVQVQQYDALYGKGGWTRRRLLLKVAHDPLNPGTERQVLLAIGALTALIVWRGGKPTASPPSSP